MDSGSDEVGAAVVPDAPDGSRDELWNATFTAYYDAFFNELVSENVASTWQGTDDLTKVVVALTASSSAVTGWVLWQDPGFKVAWGVIAGIGAVSSIVHTALRVPGRLSVWGEVRRSFANVRLALETLQHRMKVNPTFSVEEFEEEFLTLRHALAEAIQHLPPDMLATNRLRRRCQRELNEKLGLPNEGTSQQARSTRV